jgi:glycosyl transferase family 25
VQIYYINLARRTDRRAFMEAQFARLGLAATRIEAVTPDDLTDADRQGKREHWISGALSNAALCCSLSHHRALNALLATSEPWGLILEDDAVLSTRLPPFLKAFAKAPPKALLVRIEAAVQAHLTLAGDIARFGGVGLHRYTGGGIGSAGYLMSRDGARMVLDDDATYRTDIDTAIFHDTVGLARRLGPLQANPDCVSRLGWTGRIACTKRSRRIAVALSLVAAGGEGAPSRCDSGPPQGLWRFVLGGERTKVPFSVD